MRVRSQINEEVTLGEDAAKGRGARGPEAVGRLPELPADVLQRVFDAAPLGVCVLDATGLVRWANSKLAAMLIGPGAVPADALRRGLDRWVGRDDAVALQTLLRELAKGYRESARLELTAKHPDDTLVKVRLLVVSLGDANSGAAALAMLEELSRTSRSAVLASRRASLTSMPTTDHFLSDIGAEFRSPMNAVIGLSTLLLQTELDGDQRRFVEALRQSGDSMLALIDDVLDMSQLQAGNLELEATDFDLEALMAGIADEHCMRARDGVDLVVAHAPPDIGALRGDPLRIRQIIANLVANALRFTHTGHVLLSAKVEEQSGDHVQLRISVEDTGVGISADGIRHLFTRYQSDHDGVQYGGSGLGLALTRELTRLMGGKVGAMSQPGAGSTFWVRLKLQRGTAPAPAWSDGALAAKRVLVVDRSEARRYVMRQTLGRFGALVSTCSSGRDALEAILQARAFQMPYDMVLLGARLDDMTGDALARVLKADGSIGDTALVSLLPAMRQADPDRLARRGFTAALRQPIHQRQLVAALTNLPRQLPSPGPRVPPPPLLRRDEPPSVLVLDEDKETGAHTSQLLRDLGCRVTLATAGREALARLQAAEYDLVLLDGAEDQLPALQSAATSRRRGGSSAHIPIVNLRQSSGEQSRTSPPGLPRGGPGRLPPPERRKSPTRNKALARLIDRFATNARRHSSSAQ